MKDEVNQSDETVTRCSCPFRTVVLRGRNEKVQVHHSPGCAGYGLDHLYYGEAFSEVPQ